ncbi:ShlB/FhaC/HecB family hemolysin secretion/activation protein [Paraburkholderia phenoliruptrix]|uniref:ShlB/FhaC/HecB family hemolysin secretion/activation protein n=1 Tax=Paraburkholderia phenoliruptrix TaxID=252970 RepID=A0ABV3WAX1_9BURK
MTSRLTNGVTQLQRSVDRNGHKQLMTLRTKLPTPIGLAILILAAPAYAQSLPNAGSLLNQQQMAPQPRAPQATTPEEVIPSEAAPGAAEPEAGPTVTLKSITFNGDKRVADAEDLQSATASMVGKKLTHAGLQKIADTITQYLRGRGYALAYAYLAPQDLTAGNLVITIVEGRLESGKDRVTIHGKTRSSNERIAAIANAALPTDRPLKKEDLERALLLINDRPGVSAKAILQKGAQPGTSKLLIEATPTPIVNGLLSIDNYGNRSTGIERGTATFFVNDPLGMGDQVTLGLSKTQGTEVANLGYSVPLTPTGLTLLLGGSYLHYRVVQEAYSALDLRGSAVTGSAGLNYPLIRTRTQNLNATMMYDYKYLKDSALDVNLSKRKLDNLTFSLSGNRYDGLLQGGVTEGRVAVTLGHVDLSGNPVDQLADSMTAGTQGTFTKLAANFSRLQTLDQNWSVYGGWAGQLSNTNLDSSEKFLLGGPTGVRGYPVGEGSGDEGWLGTVELRRFVNIGVPSVKVQALGFVDVGQIRLHHTNYAGSQINEGHTNRVTLTSAGLGVNVWSGRWNAHAAVARTIGRNDGASLSGNNADGLSTSWRAWLQLGMAF